MQITSVADCGAGGRYEAGGAEAALVTRLRHLPGRRTVWRATCGGREVLLKIYHRHPKQTRDADAEWENALRLAAAGVEIPAPLFRATTAGGGVVVAFNYIGGGRTLDRCLETDADTAGALRRVFALHARQHNAGCYQADDHLGNYLCHGDRIYMLDAGTCVFRDAPLPLRDRLHNLAMLVANIPLPFHRQVEATLADYLNLCPPEIDRDLLARRLKHAVPVAVQTRLRKYLRKTRRSCSEFEREDRAGKTWLACRDLPAGLKQLLLDDPDQFFTGAPLLKDGNTCTVAEVVYEGSAYVLKRYNRKPPGYRLTHTFLAPRALRSWTAGHVLNLFGIRTPRPLACLLLKSGPLLDRGYLLMEKVSGAPLHKIEASRITADGSRIPAALARRWMELDTIGATHGDMKASNFIVDDHGQLALIDLDGLKFNRSPREHERRRGKDMKRFMKNWQGTPELAEAFRRAIAERS